MNYVDAFRNNLATGVFDPKKASRDDIRTAQLLVGTNTDGVWGPKSQAALETFQQNYQVPQAANPYEGQMQFRWQGMTGGDAAQAYTAHDTRRLAEIEQQIARNEQKIQELKEEYARLQQENKDSVGEMERKIAANRAGIGDSSQYNAWRAREESRAASENARQEDNKGKLSVLKSKVNNAMRDLSYARGEKQEAVARQIYDDALAEYNKAAQAAGEPQMAPNTYVSGKTVTMFDTKDFIRQHRDSKGHWDSEENKNTAYEMAHSLGDEGVQLLDEIFGQKTQAKAASDSKNYKAALKAAVAHLIGKARSGEYPITVQGKQKMAKVTAEGDKKKIYVDGQFVDEWEVK